MQCALPVVSTCEGGIPNIVEHQETGFVVESQNAKMLEEKIAVLLEDKSLRMEMGKKGYARFKHRFTMDTFEKNMDRVFQQVLNFKSSRETIYNTEVV